MTPPADPARQIRALDLLYFRDPRRWQTWPFLAVARPCPGATLGRQLGVLYDARRVSGKYGFSATVFLANIFQMPRTEEEFLALPRCVYDTAEEMAADGWIVG